MYEIATVIEADGEWATIRVQRSPACQGCNACSDSYANHMMVGRAKNLLGAEVGDCVKLEVPTRHVFAVTAMVYLLPIALMLLGYGVGSLVSGSRGIAVIGGLAGLAGGMVLVSVLGSRLSRSEQLDPVVRAIIRQNPDREVK